MITNSKNINSGSISTHGGNIHIGDIVIVNSQFADLAKNISRLKRLLELPISLKEKVQYRAELEKEEIQMQAFKKEVLRIYEILFTTEIASSRLEEAKKMFKEGNLKKVEELLDTQALESDYQKLISEKERLENRIKQNSNKLFQLSEEYLILAHLQLLDIDNNDRFNSSLVYFQKSIECEERFENLHDYAIVLSEYGAKIESIKIYKRILNLIKSFKFKISNNELIEVLNDYAVNNLYLDTRVAISLFSRAIELINAKQEDLAIDPYLIETVYINLSIAYSELGDNYNAKKILQEFRDKANLTIDSSGANDFKVTLRLFSSLSKILINEGDFNNALRNYQTIFHAISTNQNYSQDIEVLEIAADVYHNTGNVYSILGNLEESLNSYEKSEKIISHIQSATLKSYDEDLGDIFYSQGLIYSQIQSYNNARTLLAKAKDIFESLVTIDELSYSGKLALVYGALGNLYDLDDENDFNKYDIYFNKAVSILDQPTSKDILSLVNIQTNYGNYKSRNEPSVAMNLYNQAENTLEGISRINDETKLSLAQIKYMKGRCFLKLNDLNSSIQNFLEALKILISFPEATEEIKTYTGETMKMLSLLGVNITDFLSNHFKK